MKIVAVWFKVKAEDMDEAVEFVHQALKQVRGRLNSDPKLVDIMVDREDYFDQE